MNDQISMKTVPGYIIDKQCTSSPSVIGPRNRSEGFLTGLEYFQGNFSIYNFSQLRFKIEFLNWLKLQNRKERKREKLQYPSKPITKSSKTQSTSFKPRP